MNKKQQRAIIRERLNDASLAYFKDSSRVICERLYEYIKRKDAHYILSYQPTSKEVDLTSLNERLVQEGVTVGYPLVVSEDIKFYISNQFQSGSYGIKEPVNGLLVDEKLVDLVIVPLVGFDKNKNRLGHGKGYYDRYLNNKKVTKIGVGFEIQRLPDIIVEENDVSLDYILSENGWY